MKLGKCFVALVPVCAFLFFTQVNLTSCQKQIQFVHDTIYKKDTVIFKDTIRITDTLECESCYNLKDSLVAHYNFNGGNLNDSSGYGNHISFNNATKTADRFGRVNNAYVFNGTNNYMLVPNSASLNPTKAITLAAIFKINDFYRGNCGANQVFGKGWNDFINGYYVLRYRSLSGCNTTIDTSKEVVGAEYGNLSTRTSAITDNYFLHANVWYNIIYTYEEGVSKLYINGTLVKTNNAAAAVTPNSQELYIGKHGDPAFPYLFNGVIDEIRIYKKALCEEEVKLLNKLKD